MKHWMMTLNDEYFEIIDDDEYSEDLFESDLL